MIWLPDPELRSILENLSPKEMVKGTFRDRELLKSLVLELNVGLLPLYSALFFLSYQEYE